MFRRSNIDEKYNFDLSVTELEAIAFGRELNPPSRRIAEKSLTEIFPAEYFCNC